MTQAENSLFIQVVSFLQGKMPSEPIQQQEMHELYFYKLDGQLDSVIFRKSSTYITIQEYSSEIGIRIFDGKENFQKKLRNTYEWRFSDFSDAEQLLQLFIKCAKNDSHVPKIIHADYFRL